MAQTVSSDVTCYPVRLRPGQEIRGDLLKFVEVNDLKAAFIMSCVGSVTKATIRTADSKTIKTFDGPFEIVSLVGTLSGSAGHLHVCLSDADGHVIGGHVVSDLIVRTTAEVMIGECSNVTFTREPDLQTGYDELVINKRGMQRSCLP